MPQQRRNTIRFWAGLLLALLLFQAPPVRAADPMFYQMYTNSEHYGVVIFPKDWVMPELDSFLESLGFNVVESGEAVMRFGEKRENMTYMMPQDIQEKHGIKKFITLQILGPNAGIMVGIYEQEFGLTLPSQIFDLGAVQQNIPKTLEQFREQEGKKRT